MIAALYKNDGVYTLLTEEPLIHVNYLVEKYVPLEVVQVRDIKTIFENDPNPELVLLPVHEDMIWIYGKDNLPDGWTFKEAYAMAQIGKILPAKVINGKELPLVDMRDMDRAAREAYSEWFKEHSSGT